MPKCSDSPTNRFFAEITEQVKKCFYSLLVISVLLFCPLPGKEFCFSVSPLPSLLNLLKTYSFMTTGKLLTYGPLSSQVIAMHRLVAAEIWFMNRTFGISPCHLHQTWPYKFHIQKQHSLLNLLQQTILSIYEDLVRAVLGLICCSSSLSRYWKKPKTEVETAVVQAVCAKLEVDIYIQCHVFHLIQATRRKCEKLSIWTKFKGGRGPGGEGCMFSWNSFQGAFRSS